MTSRRVGMNPAITVEKIPIPPIPPPAEPPSGKPVTGLKEVRLLHNLIVPDGEKSRLIPRGEIVDIDLVPERLRTDQLIEAPDAFRENKIMMLHDASFAVPSFDGERTVYRERLFSAYSLVDSISIPNRIMETLVEGQDYLSSWDETERQAKELERKEAVEGILDGRTQPGCRLRFQPAPSLR